MNILLDNIIYSKVTNGGVSNYWFELTKFLLESESNVKFIEGQKDNLNFHRKQLGLQSNSIILEKKSTFLSRILPVNYKTDEQIIYHSSYYRKLKNAKNQIEVTTIHDFIHDYYSSFVKKKAHNFLKYNTINRSKGIICISNNTFSDLKKFCNLKKEQRVEVIYNGVSDEFFPLKEQHTDKFNSLIDNRFIDCEYLLFIGGRTNYKNFNFVTDVINEVKNIKLVIIGGKLTEKEKEKFSREALDRVVVLNYISNEELNFLFNHATALIYPSSYEGFGIPLIESMKAGCPVIGLNTVVNKEITESKAILIDELKINEVLKYLTLLKNNDFKEKLVNEGYNVAKKYSWEKCCRETYNFYEELYSL